MEIVCLDMEGTLTPEIWQQVSINTGIKDFAKTTRDIPSYSDLMDERIKIMRDHKISLKDIQFAASQLELLEGAKDFLDRIREKFQVVILSDTFHEIASPLMAKLGFPFLLCHTLKVENGIIVDYELRQEISEALEEIQTIKKPLDLTKEEIQLLSTMVKEEIELATMGEAENILKKLNFLFVKLAVNK